MRTPPGPSPIRRHHQRLKLIFPTPTYPATLLPRQPTSCGHISEASRLQWARSADCFELLVRSCLIDLSEGNAPESVETSARAAGLARFANAVLREDFFVLVRSTSVEGAGPPEHLGVAR